MQYPDDFIEKVREASDVVEIIGQHTVLKTGGRSLMGLCPFPSHQEKSPSFSVSPDKQLYHCFGCGKSGNVYSFLRDYYGYTFPESVEYLAKKAGIPLPTKGYEQNDGFRKKLDEQKKILGLSRIFFSRSLTKLPPDHLVQRYLKSRGMGEKETIENLSVGWAPDGWSGLVEFLKQNKVSLSAAEELGLIRKKKQGNDYFDMFRARVMFPVFSFAGETLGFGGRVLGDEKPKYLNSPESVLFKKSKILYGQNWSSPSMRETDEAVVVEGYTDWIALYLSGIKNGLATMGTALTQEHTKKIKRWCSKVVCLFDGDTAGVRASERALIHLLQSGVLARGVFLPQGEDPDSFLKKNGPQKMKEEIKNAGDLFLQILDQKLKDYKGMTHEKVEAISWVVQTVSHLSQDSPLVSIYLQEVDSRLRVGVPVLRKELVRFLNAKKSSKAAQPQVQSEALMAPMPIPEDKKVRIKYKKTDPEFILFSLALEGESRQKELIDKKFAFKDPGTQFLWEIVTHKHRQGTPFSDTLGALLVRHCVNPEALTLTLERPYSQLDEKQKDDFFHESLRTAEKRQLNAQAKTLTKKIGHDAADEELKEFLELQKKKRSLSKLKD